MAVPLNARTRTSVIDKMVQLAAATGWLWDPDKMAEAVAAREHLHSTALDNGVALLHPRRPQPNILAQPFLAFGRTHRGIPFGDARGRLTDVFFLILSTDDRGHLRTLARLSRLIGDCAVARSDSHGRDRRRRASGDCGLRTRAIRVKCRVRHTAAWRTDRGNRRRCSWGRQPARC